MKKLAFILFSTQLFANQYCFTILDQKLLSTYQTEFNFYRQATRSSSNLELEIRLNDDLLKNISPYRFSTGSYVGGLFIDTELSSGSRAMLENSFPDIRPRLIEWNKLSLDQRRILIRDRVQNADTQRIQNTIVFVDNTDLQIDLALQRDNLNYINARVYPHNNRYSGDLLFESIRYFEGHGADSISAQSRIIVDIPEAEFLESPQLASARLSEFFRRSSLLVDIVEDFYGVSRNRNITSENLESIIQYFYGLKNGPEHNSIDHRPVFSSPLGITQRSHPGMWGMTYQLPTGFTMDQSQHLLNAIQEGIDDPGLGLLTLRLRRILNSQDRDATPLELSSFWYNRPLTELTSSLSETLQESGVITIALRRELEGITTIKPQIKMLLYNWRNDPIFASSSRYLSRIEASQIQAIQKLKEHLANGTLSDYFINDTLRTFYASSGLFTHITQMFGLDMNRVVPFNLDYRHDR